MNDRVRIALFLLLVILVGNDILNSTPGALTRLKGIAASPILNLVGLGITVAIAYLTWKSAQASERSALTMERTFKAANDSTLLLEFLIIPKVLYPYPDVPSRTRSTPELEQLRADWARLTPEQSQTRKHGIYATVQNLGPSVARRVSFVARIRIAPPNADIFTKEVRLDEIPILKVGYRQNVLAYVFDDVTDRCGIGFEHGTITYTTSEGETKSDEWSYCEVLRLGESPIRNLDQP
jgi:hypothetical protein